ncbi:hyaluronidase, partial [Streptomyces sp. 2MCAF27]
AQRAAADGDAATSLAPTGPVTVSFDRARPLTAVSALTGRAAVPPGTVWAHVPEEGWRKLGAVSGSGWTQLAGRGVRADAVRLVWEAGTTPPDVHEITPWFADTPAAELRLSRDTVDAETGGRAVVVEAHITPRRPKDIHGELTVHAPRGIRVTADKAVTARRGSTTTARIEVSIPEGTKAGTFTVPVRFGSQQTVLTVRAFPPTGGSDLVRADGTKATSSADETADFPASAAIDGDPATRWSSP